MPRNIEFLPALPISSYSVGRNHDPGNTDTAKSNLSLSIQFGTVEYLIGSGGIELSGAAATQYTAGQTEQPIARDSFDSFSYLVRREARPIGLAGYRTTYEYVGVGVLFLEGSAKISVTKSVAVSNGVLSLTATAPHSKTVAIRGRAGARLRKPGSGRTEYLRASWLVEEEEFLRLIA